MNTQLDLLEGLEVETIDDSLALKKAKEKLEKIHRNTTGLFRRLNELKAEAEVCSAIIEQIEFRSIYGACG